MDLENNSGNKPKGVLNFEEIGKIIAVIKDDGDDKKKSIAKSIAKSKSKSNPGRNLYVADNKTATNEGVRHPEYEIELSNNQHFQIAINKETERQIGYICGGSGGGKSYFCKKYIEEYHKTYPSRPIYVLSALTEDPTLDSLKCIERIKLTPEFLDDDLTAKDFENALLLLDDTDTISNRKMRLKVNQLRDDILSTGRHFNTSILVTTHTPANGFETKLILNEAHFVSICPAALGGRAKSYLLETYLGLDKKQIRKLKNIDSRVITFIKGHPQVVLAERTAYILTDEE